MGQEVAEVPGTLSGKNLVRYHGVLARNARARAEIVQSARAAGDAGGEPPNALAAPALPKTRTGRYLLWHELLRRVFAIDVLACPKCGGRLRLLCTVHDGFSARRCLRCVNAQSPPADPAPTSAGGHHRGWPIHIANARAPTWPQCRRARTTTIRPCPPYGL